MTAQGRIFICPGCNRASTRAVAGAIALINGREFHYVLCPRCGAQLQKNPAAMVERVEATLLKRSAGGA